MREPGLHDLHRLPVPDEQGRVVVAQRVEAGPLGQSDPGHGRHPHGLGEAVAPDGAVTGAAGAMVSLGRPKARRAVLAPPTIRLRPSPFVSAARFSDRRRAAAHGVT